MNTRRPLLPTLAACLLALGAAGPVLAQPVEQPPPPAPPAPAEGQAPTETPPAEAPPAETPADPAPSEAPAEAPPAEPGARTVEDRLADLEGKMEGMGEPFSAMQVDVASLKKLKFSGYVQGRYEWKDDADFGQEFRNNAVVNRGANRFLVRRARLKSTYVGDLSEFVLQIDATGDGVALRDAEASFHLTNENPWLPGSTPWELKLTLGQFKVPFGFEVLQSSGDRELPERTAVIRALIPNERDRGLRLVFNYHMFRLMAAVLNGNFTNDSVHGTFDQSSWKDVAGRIGGDFEFVAVGFSAHVGRFLRQTAAASMANPVARYERYSRLRLGGDAQVYLDVPGLGGLTLRGEAIWSRDKQMDFGGVEPSATRCRDADRFGWYGTLVQNLGDNFGVAVRFDQYDPISRLDDACMAMDTVVAAERDKQNNVGVALLAHISGNLKFTLAYDHFGEHEAVQRDNDAVTVQLQAKF